MKRLAFILCVLAWPCFGQDVPTPPVVPTPSLTIEGPTEGKRDDYNDFVAGGAPEKGTFQWIVLPLDNSLRVREFEGGKKISIVGPPGRYVLLLSVSDGTAKSLDKHDFVIPGDIPTPPTPPNPPVVLTLSQLAGKDAQAVSIVYVELLKAIGKGSVASIEDFRAKEAAALEAAGVTGHGATAEIAKRTAVTLDKLAGVLESIIKELAAPAPVPSGKRIIVLVHETADDDAAMGRLIVNIRDGEIAKYLKDNGHSAYILDDDLESPMLAKLRPFDSLPMVYVLDKETQAVIYKQSAPMAGPDFLAAIKKGGA